MLPRPTSRYSDFLGQLTPMAGECHIQSQDNGSSRSAAVPGCSFWPLADFWHGSLLFVLGTFFFFNISPIARIKYWQKQLKEWRACFSLQLQAQLLMVGKSKQTQVAGHIMFTVRSREQKRILLLCNFYCPRFLLGNGTTHGGKAYSL